MKRGHRSQILLRMASMILHTCFVQSIYQPCQVRSDKLRAVALHLLSQPSSCAHYTPTRPNPRTTPESIIHVSHRSHPMLSLTIHPPTPQPTPPTPSVPLYDRPVRTEIKLTLLQCPLRSSTTVTLGYLLTLFPSKPTSTPSSPFPSLPSPPAFGRGGGIDSEREEGRGGGERREV